MSGNEFGKLFKRAWGDVDFKKLTGREQHLYFKLISQPDISLAGVLTYASTRWAMQTKGLSVQDIEATLSSLAANRYVVVDMDTQEVLVRSYIRNDLGWRSPRTMIGIANATGRVLSPLLRGVISRELGRLDTSGLSDTINEKTNRSTREVVESSIRDIIKDSPPRDTPSVPSGDGVSDTPSDTANGGVGDGVDAVRAHNSNHNCNGNSRSRSNSISLSDAAASTEEPRVDVESICNHLATRIEQNGAKRPSIGKTWTTAARLLIDADGRRPTEIHALIDWCQSDGFWKSNILSMPKLREKYDQLLIKSRQRTSTPQATMGNVDWRTA